MGLSTAGVVTALLQELQVDRLGHEVAVSSVRYGSPSTRKLVRLCVASLSFPSED